MASVLRYPGGKSRMLKTLQPFLDGLMAGETEYAEPFVGGGSVALHVATRYPAVQRIYLNDKDGLVAAFWRIVAKGGAECEELASRLKVKPTVAMWDQVKATEDKTDVDKAFKLVFLNRTSFNGMVHNSSPIGGRSQGGKKGGKGIWLIDCQYNPARLADLIQSYSQLLAGKTVVTEQDARQFIAERSGVPQFLDPPYFPTMGENRLYGVYMPPQEHLDLARATLQVRKFVMTYDFSKEVKSLYNHVAIHTIPVKYSSTSTRKSGTWKKKSEIVAVKGFTVPQ